MIDAPSIIKVKDLVFERLISDERIQSRIQEVADELSLELADKNPLFIPILNGAFLFAADLLKKLKLDCQVSFIRLASYDGMRSTGNVKELIGLDQDISHRHIVILEDIVDSGKTLHELLPMITKRDPASIKVATLLKKPAKLIHDVQIDHIGFEIAEQFVVGYGLDYDGYGRNLKDLYVLKES